MDIKAGYTFKILALAFLYFILGKFAFMFAISYGTVTSAIFFSEGVALAFVLLSGWKVSPGIFLGQMLLCSTSSLTLYTSVVISAGNTAEALLALWILKRLKFDPGMNTLRDYLTLVFVIFAFLQPVSAGIGVSSLYIFENVRGGDLLLASVYWWLGNSMGQMLLTPVILRGAVIIRNGYPFIIKRIKEVAVSLLITGFVSCLIFLLWGSCEIMHNIHAFFLLLPVVIFLSIKFDFTGAVTSSLVISLIAQIFTVKGIGPFSGGDVQSDLISLNVFIISVAVSAGLAGILFYERKVNEDMLRHALDEIKVLQGILPICSSCKKVRNDKGYWEQIESYIENHSEAEFTHSLCEDCARRLYGNEKWFEEDEKKE